MPCDYTLNAHRRSRPWKGCMGAPEFELRTFTSNVYVRKGK